MGGDVAAAPRIGVVPPGAPDPARLLDDGEVPESRPGQLDGGGEAGEPTAHDDHAGEGPALQPGRPDLPLQPPPPDVQRHVSSLTRRDRPGTDVTGAVPGPPEIRPVSAPGRNMRCNIRQTPGGECYLPS